MGARDGHWIVTPIYEREAQPELTAAWVQAVERGIAGDLCDRIVRTREIPDRLVNVLCNALAGDDNIYKRRNRELEQKYRHRNKAA